MDATDAARAYYEAVDAGDYDRLAALLAPDFAQRRPDRTLVGRDSFVSFMRDRRPRTDSTHHVDAVYRLSVGAAGERLEATGDVVAEVAVRGRVRTDDGELGFGFVDVFAVDEDGRLASLRTYTA
jgi:Nuclear transport factor 2 (NTF2) domain.